MRGAELRPQVPRPRPQLPGPRPPPCQPRPGPGLGLGLLRVWRGRHLQAGPDHSQLRGPAGAHEGQDRGVQPRRPGEAQHLVHAQPLHRHRGQDVHHQGVGRPGDTIIHCLRHYVHEYLLFGDLL